MLATLWRLFNAVLIVSDFDRPSFNQSESQTNHTTDSNVTSELLDAVAKSVWRSSQCPCQSGWYCVFDHCVLVPECPPALKFGPGPASFCVELHDPHRLPSHPAEEWFTAEIFKDLFPKANLGWGPSECQPYSYEAFRIAMRYFPRFANEKGLKNGYSDKENWRRDLAAFFAHAVQETGENDANLYELLTTKEMADACFYRGGFFNWFEGGPMSMFLNEQSPGYSPNDGNKCKKHGLYCTNSTELNYWYPCVASRNESAFPLGDEDNDRLYTSCYFGRGAIQISYNYNYGQFQEWLRKRRIFVDLLAEPNLIITKRDPPLAMMASIWYYMTPQPPKPAMHDIVMGNWEPGEQNRKRGYSGPIFGPTSLVINNECNGEDSSEPGGPGESRRIKAFKWFCAFFGVSTEEEHLLSCKGMPQKLEAIRHPRSWQPDWTTTWKQRPCNCKPASYGGMIPYFADGFYPSSFVEKNEANRRRCVFSIYDQPALYSMEKGTSQCLNFPFSDALFRSANHTSTSTIATNDNSVTN